MPIFILTDSLGTYYEREWISQQCPLLKYLHVFLSYYMALIFPTIVLEIPLLELRHDCSKSPMLTCNYLYWHILSYLFIQIIFRFYLRTESWREGWILAWLRSETNKSEDHIFVHSAIKSKESVKLLVSFTKINKVRDTKIGKADLEGKAGIQRPALPTLLSCPSLIKNI